MTKVCAENTACLISKYIAFCNSKPNSRFPQLKELGISEDIEVSEKLRSLMNTGIAYHHSGSIAF